MKRLLKNGGNYNRPKTWLGAVIGAATGILGSVISSNAQKNAAREQERLQKYKMAVDSANQLSTNLTNTQAAQNEYESRFRLPYKEGGKRHLRNVGAKLTDGGPVMNLSTGEFYYPGDLIPSNVSVLDLGYSHNSKNPQGKTGTGWIADNIPFETQKGEVAKVNSNNIKVYSDSLKLSNGKTPAENVLEGKDETEIFNKQQNMNGNNRINRKRKLRNGGIVLNTSDWIGLGTNLLGSIISSGIANNAADNLVDPERPISYNPGKLITNYNISPELSEINESKLKALKDTDEMVSSAGRLNRRNIIRQAALEQSNKLQGTKTNKEIELINADTLNQQEGRYKSIKDLNDYYTALGEAKDRRTLARAAALQTGVSGIGQSVGNFLQQGIDNYQADQARLAYIASSPYGTAERLHSLGYDFNDNVISGLRNEAKVRMDRFSNDNTDSGIKSYNNALDSYNYWNDALNGGIKKKHNKPSLRTVTPNIYYNPFTGQGSN